MNLQTLKQRLQNPLFRLALAGFTYQSCKQAGVVLDEELFRTGIDILSWLLIGSGVFTNFSNAPSQPPGTPLFPSEKEGQ